MSSSVTVFRGVLPLTACRLIFLRGEKGGPVRAVGGNNPLAALASTKLIGSNLYLCFSEQVVQYSAKDAHCEIKSH